MFKNNIISILSIAIICFITIPSLASQNKNFNINSKLTEVCNHNKGNVFLDEKGIVMCRIYDNKSLNISYLKTIYGNNLNSPSLFIAWDIKDKNNKSFTLDQTQNLDSQKTLNWKDFSVDIYVYYSNITNIERKKVSIKKADVETLNNFIKQTKNTINLNYK